MAITGTSDADERERPPKAALTVTGLAFLVCSTAFGGELESQVTIGITHTDNIFLATENEESEKIYRVEPSFHFSQETSRITANADYLLQAFRYHDLSENEVFHQYDASIRAALLPDVFFLEVGGSRDQVITDPELNIPASNLPISRNRQNVDQYYAAPSFQYGLGSDVTATGEYRHRWVEYGEELVQGNEQSDATFSLDNYRRARGLTWALRYDWQRAEYEQEIPWEYQRAMAEVGFWAGTNTRFFAAAGKESSWYTPFDPQLEDDLWEAGFSQQVGERLHAEFAAGERSFGSSWRGNLDFEFRRGNIVFSYAETPTTAGRVRYRLDAFDEQEIPDDFLTHAGSTERFISKALQLVLNLELRRSTISLGAFHTDRTDRTQADGTPLEDESARGARLRALYQVGPRTGLRMEIYRIEREFRQSSTTDLIRASAAADYRVGNRTMVTLEYLYAREDGESPSAIRDYVANTVSLLLTRTF